MEFLTNFAFKLDCNNWYKNPIFIGNINNSSWSFKFDYYSGVGYCMDITRSSTSQTCGIISVFSILFEKPHDLQEESALKYIVDGDINVLFPCTFQGIFVKEISGSIIILKLLDSSSKEPQISIPPSVANINPLSKVSDDFLRILNDPDSFPDATLKCGSEKILVHKAILSARSSVFAAMFKTEMQESDSGIVDIVDIEPDVLQATLKYVYSGKTDHLNDGIAGDVLFAANKYQLEELKTVCIEILKSSMTADNVFRILILGDLHDECLKMRAKEFVCKCDKFSNLEKTEGWKLLQSENPGLAMEVLLFVVKFEQNLSTKSISSK